MAKGAPTRGSATSTPGTQETSSPATPADTTRWGQPVFVDNFASGQLDPNDWIIYNAPYGNPISGTPYTSQSVTVAHGYLNLTGHYQAPYGYVGGGVATKAYRTYGRWVIRFRCDNGAGYEPAVLLWPKGSHADGEIDVAEVFPGSVLPVSTNRRGAGQFLHKGADSVFIGHVIPKSVDFAQWQTVAVDWLPHRITMWLNGRPTWTVARDYDGIDFIPHAPFHLALQLDEGCTHYRCSPNKATPAKVHMQVDWVKIYAAPRVKLSG